MKLLINADDLGYSPLTNQAIFDLHHRGRLSSTSLVANLPHSQHAIDGLQRCPDLAIGVHLNLTKGHPVLPPEQIPTLVDPTGKFWFTKDFYARALTGRINTVEMQAELRAQIERLLDFGFQPTHLDSHAHWHVLPALGRLIIQLAREYQVSRIRQAALRRTLLPNRFWLAAASRNAHPVSKPRTADFFFSLHHWIGSDGAAVKSFYSEELRRLVARPNITLEMVTHPGWLQDPHFPPDTLLTYQRQWEYDFLLSPGFDRWLEMVNAEVINHETV
jgi:predicted glycoside hydrolase/deacetylase ChbG (UPF0249 family)